MVPWLWLGLPSHLWYFWLLDSVDWTFTSLFSISSTSGSWIPFFCSELLGFSENFEIDYRFVIHMTFWISKKQPLVAFDYALKKIIPRKQWVFLDSRFVALFSSRTWYKLSSELIWQIENNSTVCSPSDWNNFSSTM